MNVPGSSNIQKNIYNTGQHAVKFMSKHSHISAIADNALWSRASRSDVFMSMQNTCDSCYVTYVTFQKSLIIHNEIEQ